MLVCLQSIEECVYGEYRVKGKEASGLFLKEFQYFKMWSRRWSPQKDTEKGSQRGKMNFGKESEKSW